MPFTKKDLQFQCDDVNKTLDKAMGHQVGFRYHTQSRNGYTALDLFGNTPNGGWNCIRNLAIGTPRECSAEMFSQAFWQLAEHNSHLQRSKAP
jgi:hypothetical protein